TLGYLGNGVPVYFRRHFLVPDTNGVVLTLFDVVEDGAVYYINGQEVFRHRVNAGAVTFTTVAVGATENTGPEGPFSIPATNLVAGDNVIAAVVIQSTLAGSTDIEFAAELHAIVSSVPSGPPVIAAQPQGQSVAEGATVTFSVTASGAQPLSYQWRLNGGDITGANSSSYTINGVAPAQAGTYTVVVANSVDSVTSANAVLNVSPDVTAPVYISAIGSPNLTNITLTITDNFGLNQASVEDISHYSVHLTAGGGNLTIVSATLVNNSNILLTTSERTQSQSYTVDINNIIDRAQTPNAVAPLSRPLLAGIVVLAPDAVTLWRFETSSNNLDGIGWQAPAFNDASWTTGLAGFTTPTDEFSTNGFELRTTNMIAPDSSGPITTYYRVPFNFPGAVANARLHIIGVIDDGLVAYINGVEAGRLRVTNNPVSFTNLASANSPEATGNIHLPLDDVLLNTSALVTGNNLLAIELHQSSATSSDAVLSVQLAAEIEQFGTSPTGPTLRVSLGGGSVTITWTGGGTLQRSLDLNSPSNWQTIPGAISGFQTNVSATNQMFFRVTVP
ncbi:MAG TPA: immunoglobulin domain-containing protein, partial [Candidatus Limnocylindria bacterium]|nr:immunoglobulin domain-containing protein [Candidatus Limnocylindria bacterium]